MLIRSSSPWPVDDSHSRQWADGRLCRSHRRRCGTRPRRRRQKWCRRKHSYASHPVRIELKWCRHRCSCESLLLRIHPTFYRRRHSYAWRLPRIRPMFYRHRHSCESCPRLHCVTCWCRRRYRGSCLVRRCASCCRRRRCCGSSIHSCVTCCRHSGCCLRNLPLLPLKLPPRPNAKAISDGSRMTIRPTNPTIIFFMMFPFLASSSSTVF